MLFLLMTPICRFHLPSALSSVEIIYRFIIRYPQRRTMAKCVSRAIYFFYKKTNGEQEASDCSAGSAIAARRCAKARTPQISVK